VSDEQKKPLQPFDDALPERLIRHGESGEEGRGIKMHKGTPEMLSPYIVKLSHKKGEPLGESFIIEDADIFPDEAPLVEYHEGKLHFAEDHAIAQIIEENGKDELPIIAPYPAERGYDLAVPAIEVLRGEPRDIFADLLADEQEEKKQEVVLEEVLDQLVLPEKEHTQEEEKEEKISEEEREAYVISYANGQEERVVGEEAKGLQVMTLPKKQWKVHAKASLAFATLAAIVLLPLQASFVFADALSTKHAVEAQGSAGLSQFLRGADALQEQNFSAASALFGNASGAFASASASLEEVHGVVAAAVSLIPSTEKTASTAEALLDIGESVSRASALLARGIEEVSAAQALSVTDRLAVMVAYTEEALPEMKRAASAAEHVDLEVIPEETREKVARMVRLVPVLAQSFEEVIVHADALGAILGGQDKRRYMVVFQNNTELRPTGGFMGSFAEVAFEDGAIEEMIIPGGGTYDVQGQLRAFVAAPGPLQLLRPRWEFQDANWFPDFPTSARKMLWFYQSAGGPSVDGVLAINASVLEKMLTVVGPLTLADGTELNAENVLFELQKEVEIDYDKAQNAPKAAVGELTELIFKKLETADAQTLMKVASAFVDALNTKDMQVYFSDNTMQATMKELGWTGEVRATADDYLMVVNTNVGGGKTDAVIARDVTVDAYIAEDGTIENTVTITQTHRGMVNALFTGINNVNYLRIYVPQGSTYITGTGFEVPPGELFQTAEYPLVIDEDLELAMQNIDKDPITQTDIWNEQGKTVFGNWIQTAPGETQIVTFTYRLPWRAMRTPEEGAWEVAKQVFGAREALSYAMVVQKQSGVAQNVLVRVHAPASFSQLWSSDQDEDREVFIESQQNDLFAGWIFER
jgi:hypothetical protein